MCVCVFCGALSVDLWVLFGHFYNSYMRTWCYVEHGRVVLFFFFFFNCCCYFCCFLSLGICRLLYIVSLLHTFIALCSNATWLFLLFLLLYYMFFFFPYFLWIRMWTLQCFTLARYYVDFYWVFANLLLLECLIIHCDNCWQWLGKLCK